MKFELQAISFQAMIFGAFSSNGILSNFVSVSWELNDPTDNSTLASTFKQILSHEILSHEIQTMRVLV